MGGLRVLMVATAYPPSVGGAQLHAHQLAIALRERGVDVHAATLWRTSRADWLRGTTVRAPAPGAVELLDGVPVHQLGLTSRERLRSAAPAAAYYAAMRAMRGPLTRLFLPSLSELITEVRPHVVHLSRIGRESLYEAALTAARDAGVPVVLTPNHHPEWIRRRDRWWWDIYRRVDRLLVFTEAERQSLVAGGVPPTRIGRATIGIVGRPRLDVTRGGEPRVLFLGQAHAYKGLDLLAEAWPLIQAAHPDAHLDVVGPWPHVRDRDALRERLTNAPGVSVHGAVDDQAKWQHLARADVLCVPSSAEALGGVYLEAWEAGAVPVGADIPPVRELLVGSGGGRVVERRAQAIGEEVVKLLGRPALRAELVSAGRTELARHYTWERAADLARQAYERAGAAS